MAVAAEKGPDGERVVFMRLDPTEHALLVCKLGAHHGNLKELSSFKPPGTEWATERDINDAGFVAKKWLNVAYELYKIAILQVIQDPTESGEGAAAVRAAVAKIIGDDARLLDRMFAEEFESRAAALASAAGDTVADAAVELVRAIERVDDGRDRNGAS